MGKFALMSVSNKVGLVKFAKTLIERDFQIISTGGTRKKLEDAGLSVISVSDFTQFPEILDGRVKTLHPSIYGGILADIENPSHVSTLESLNIHAIDLVVVNLYPFSNTIVSTNDEKEIIENIDIGGPALLRAAAKNADRVTVVCDPDDYKKALEALDSLTLRKELAAKSFRRTSEYDRVIADHFSAPPDCKKELRYGENPHQKAWLSDVPNDIEVLHGKALSYNNIVDASAALDLISEFERPCVAILKHTNPVGCAIASSLSIAYKSALSGDPMSAFGGIVVCNRTINKELAELLNARFFEILIAPDFDKEAFELLKKKKDRRIVKAEIKPFDGNMIRTTRFGRLYQEADPIIECNARDCDEVTVNRPGAGDWNDLLFAWKVVKHVKSNAIVLVKDRVVVGVGAGQMSRIDALELAVKKAGENAVGSVLASDAFFPFADGPESAHAYGISAIIQPGGSKRDEEVIEACNKLGLPMVFTGERHFRH